VLRTLKVLCGEAIQRDFETWVQSYTAVVRQPLTEQYADAEKEMTLLRSYQSRMRRRAQISRGFGMFVAMAGLIASAWVWYSSEQSGLSMEEFVPFLAVTSAVAIYGSCVYSAGKERRRKPTRHASTGGWDFSPSDSSVSKFCARLILQPRANDAICATMHSRRSRNNPKQCIRSVL
jgi:hypothetical protein